MTTELLPTHTAALFQAAVKRSAEVLRAGEVVALPTETVYGLAANALDQKAVAKIFEIKGRPAHNPIIIHVASMEMARRCVTGWTPLADKLAAAFWPGPLTLVLPRAANIPDNVTAGGATVGVRWPSHPFIQAVLRECDFPLAAPSANVSNHISPTNAEHVRKHLGTKLKLIVDGGQSQVGIESTVLDLNGSPPRVLRPGMIHQESLLAVIGNLQPSTFNAQHSVLRSPGLLEKHYSPKAKLVVLNWRDDADLRSHVFTFHASRFQVSHPRHTHIPADAGICQRQRDPARCRGVRPRALRRAAPLRRGGRRLDRGGGIARGQRLAGDLRPPETRLRRLTDLNGPEIIYDEIQIQRSI